MPVCPHCGQPTRGLAGGGKGGYGPPGWQRSAAPSKEVSLRPDRTSPAAAGFAVQEEAELSKKATAWLDRVLSATLDFTSVWPRQTPGKAGVCGTEVDPSLKLLASGPHVRIGGARQSTPPSQSALTTASTCDSSGSEDDEEDLQRFSTAAVAPETIFGGSSLIAHRLS